MSGYPRLASITKFFSDFFILLVTTNKHTRTTGYYIQYNILN
jgi:hypothetical protein